MKWLRILYRELRERRRISLTIVLVSFLLTFIFVRIVTHLQLAGLLPDQTGVLHIHHMVPGIILLIISGYIGIAFGYNSKIRHYIAILYGIGAALTIDEFALWLFLQDVYWERQGRNSIDAVIIFIVISVIGLVISEAHEYTHKHKKKLAGAED